MTFSGRRGKSLLNSPLPRRGGAGSGIIRRKIDSLSQGISQQPPHIRRDGTVADQVNGWSSPVEGLAKRRPAEFILKQSENQLFDFWTERFIVTDSERYRVVITTVNGLYFLGVYENQRRVMVHAHGPGIIEGDQNTRYPDGDPTNWVVGDYRSYLRQISGQFINGFVLENAGPFALVLNRGAIAQLDDALTPERAPEALLFIQAVNYNITYELTVDGEVVATYTTPRIDSGEELSATRVVTELLAAWSQDDFTTEQLQYTAWIYRPDGRDFTISLDEGNANTLGRVVKDRVSDLSELPQIAPDGFQVVIENDPTVDIDNYWLSFDTTNDTEDYGPGVWLESPAPGVKYRVDEATMPHVLRRAEYGELFFGPADGSTQTNENGTEYTFPSWAERTAGDETTVPSPAFDDFQIRDLVVFRQRLVLIAGSTVIFSKTDDVFNFWGDTATGVFETDTFDLVAVSTTSSLLNWMLPVDTGIMIFSDDSQFSATSIGDADVFGPRSAQISRLSNIQMNPELRPLLAGPNALFATEEYGYTHIREFQYFDSSSTRIGINLGGAQNVNDSTPKLIQGTARHWHLSQNLDFGVLMAPNDPNTLFVYKWLWSIQQGGTQKLQQSWSKWTFSQQVVNILFDENALDVFVTSPENGVEVLRITPEELNRPDDQEFLLDRAIDYPECLDTATTTDDVIGTYDQDTDLTTFRLPYVPVVPVYAVERTGILLGVAQPGERDLVCTSRGNYRATPIRFGEKYEFVCEFNPALLPIGGQDQSLGEQSGRLQIHTWQVFHFNTGWYEVTVDRKNRRSSTSMFRNRSTGVQANELTTEDRLTNTGRFRVPVYAKNTDCRVTVRSDNWLPITITSAEWEATYSQRSG